MATAARSGAVTGLADVALEAMERWRVPGLAVGILHNGERRVEAFGTANVESDTAVLASTLFQFGSISKIVTATAIMQLVETWRLDLDLPVRNYLPGFALLDADATETVTTRHLLTHMGGFWGDDFTDYGRGDDALERAAAALSGTRQLTRPGELLTYCNAGYQVLGRLLEVRHGKPFETVVRQRVLEPLGMEHTFYFADEAITHPAAVGYNIITDDAPKAARPYAIPRAMNAAGGCIGPVEDLLRFAAFHMGEGDERANRVLREGARLQMQELQVHANHMADHWGLGWMLNDIGGERTFGHGGSTNGFRASLLCVPGHRLAIACLANGSKGSAVYRAVEDWALSELAGVERSIEPAIESPGGLDEYAGVYRDPRGTLTIEAGRDELTMHMDFRNSLNQDPMPRITFHAVPVAADRFRVVDTEVAPAVFDFIRHPDGALRFLRFGGRLHEPVPSTP